MSNQPIFLRVVIGGKPVEMKQISVDQIVIGRGGDAGLSLRDPKAAAIHAMVEKRGESYFLCDLGTEHGTFVRGQKIVEVELKSGDAFVVGDTTVEFHVGVPRPHAPPKAPPQSKPPVKQQAPAVAPAPKPVPAPLPTPVPNATPPSPSNKLKVPAPAPVAKPSPIHAPVPKVPPTKEKSIKTDITRAVGVVAKTATGSGSGITGTANVSPLPKAPKPHKPLHKGGTFAASTSAGVRESIKPSRGNVVEVLILWKDRVLAEHHFSTTKVVYVGSHPKNDIILPVFGSVRMSHPLLKIDASTTTVILTSDMTGDVTRRDLSKVGFSDLKTTGELQAIGTNYKYALKQDEMVRVHFGEGVEIVVRFVAATGTARTAPILDISVNQLTGLIITLLATVLFLFYVFLYMPPVEEKKEDETIPPRKAQFLYKPRIHETEKVVEVRPVPKSAQETIRDKQVAPARGEEGAAQEAKPNKSRSNKQILTSDKAGKDKGIQKAAANNAKDSGAKSNAKDVTKSGVLGVFATKGIQDQLNKAYRGSGNVSGAAQGATGSGSEAVGAGNTPGNGLKEIGMGGNGTATVGIAGPQTKGRGGGLSGYGTGPLGAKKNATIIAGNDEAVFSPGIDKDAIRRVVMENIRQIKACYEKGLNRDPSLYGKITIQWTIGSGGHVTQASIKNTTMNSSEVENCAVSRLKTWKFPEPPVNELADVSYPFVFQAQE